MSRIRYEHILRANRKAIAGSAGRYLPLILIALVLALTTACAAPADDTPAEPTAAPTSLPEPTTEPPPEPEVEPEADVDAIWARIQDEGRIVVGTSADYPPFAYYPTGATVECSDLPVEGFDIGLMRELARRMGVQVEFRDFVFDGLLPAVQVEQIDVAIGAISVTPGREAVVRFSDIYYVGEDAVIALADSDVPVGSIVDLIGHKVAVQTGSVHNTWLQLGLVDTGEMPASALITFAEAQDAPDLLASGQAEFVVMDYLPAEELIKQGDFKIVAHGLNRQLYGIAVPAKATTLVWEINKALAQLQEDGKIEALAVEHLGLAPGDMMPAPTPGAEPPEEAGEPPTEGCINSMALVEELSDGAAQLSPGESFVRTFRVRNTGTCDWDDTYVIDYGGGNVDAARMGGAPITIAGVIPAGETYDVEIALTAPAEVGDYQAFWSIMDGRGVSFGERLYVSVEVAE